MSIERTNSHSKFILITVGNNIRTNWASPGSSHRRIHKELLQKDDRVEKIVLHKLQERSDIFQKSGGTNAGVSPSRRSRGLFVQLTVIKCRVHTIVEHCTCTTNTSKVPILQRSSSKVKSQRSNPNSFHNKMRFRSIIYGRLGVEVAVALVSSILPYHSFHSIASRFESWTNPQLALVFNESLQEFQHSIECLTEFISVEGLWEKEVDYFTALNSLKYLLALDTVVKVIDFINVGLCCNVEVF